MFTDFTVDILLMNYLKRFSGTLTVLYSFSDLF